MKRMFLAASALALLSGAAVAQTDIQRADPEQAQRRGTIAQPSGEGSNAGPPSRLNYQPADPTDAQRSGTIAKPSGEGAMPDGSASAIQPSDPEQASRKGGINEPGATVTR
jgi:hypothetical protein